MAEEQNLTKESLRASKYLGICTNNEANDLFRELGINYEILDSYGNSEQEFARKIGDHFMHSGKRPVIIGFPHYLMTYSVPPEATVIYFDNHADDGIDYKPQQSFTSGTFQLYVRVEQQIVLGATAKQYGKKVKVFPPNRIDEVLREPLGKKLFLSFDLDVLDPKYYKVGIYTQGSLSPEDIFRLTGKLIKDHEIVGLNVAGYTPQAKEIVKKILSPIL